MENMITICTNSLGSGDYVIIKNGEKVLFEGHRIMPSDVAYMLQRYFNTGVKYMELTDEEMEEI